jgi:hypothetical protein
MRKLMVALVALIAVITLLALGLNDNQPDMIKSLFYRMVTGS